MTACTVYRCLSQESAAPAASDHDMMSCDVTSLHSLYRSEACIFLSAYRIKNPRPLLQMALSKPVTRIEKREPTEVRIRYNLIHYYI